MKLSEEIYSRIKECGYSGCCEDCSDKCELPAEYEEALELESDRGNKD